MPTYIQASSALRKLLDPETQRCHKSQRIRTTNKTGKGNVINTNPKDFGFASSLSLGLLRKNLQNKTRLITSFTGWDSTVTCVPVSTGHGPSLTNWGDEAEIHRT